MGRKRERKIEAFVTEEELNMIDEKVKSSGLNNRSQYLRKVALGEPIINIDMSYLNNVIFELNKIGTNINQIAKYANSQGGVYKSDIKEIEEKMDKIWDIITDKL